MATTMTMRAQSGYPTETVMKVTVGFTVTYAGDYYTYFELYEDGDLIDDDYGSTFTMGANTSKSGLTKTFSGLTPGTEYTIVGSLWNATTDTRLDIDEPEVSFTTEESYVAPDIYIDEDNTTVTTESIEIYCVIEEGYSGDDYTYYVNFSIVKVTGGGAQSHSSSTFTFPSSGRKTLSWPFTGLEAGTVYKVSVELVNDDTGDIVAVDEIRVSTGKPKRPENWEWVSTVKRLSPVPTNKVIGTENDYAAAFLTKEEWYDFITRIEEFAVYLGVDFTYTDRTNCTTGVSSGSPMKASQLNGARSFILKLAPPVSPPAEVQSRGLVTAAFVNGLKDSLNSIE